MWTKRRHRIFHKVFRPVISLYARLFLNFKTKKYKLPKVAHLILYNHPTNYDPLFAGIAINHPTYFIANEDLFNIPYASKIIKYLVAPIPIQKSMMDINSVRKSLKIVKEGGNIGLAPEGNRNYSGKLNTIDPSIAKFAKLLKVPVVLYVIKGGFGAMPRFSKKRRKGRITGEISRIISKEEVKSLSNEELYKIIISNLSVDDTKLDRQFRSDASAEYLESAFYVCPACYEMHSMKSDKSHIHCNKCLTSAEYTSTLRFKSDNNSFPFETVREYYEFQDKFILNYDHKKLIYDFDEVSIYKTQKKGKRIKLFNGLLYADNDKLSITGTEDRLKFSMEDIVSMSIVYHNTIIVYLKNEKYHIIGDERFNALKYLHLYTILKKMKQGEENEYLGI